MNGYAELQPETAAAETTVIQQNSLAILDEQEVELIALANQYKDLTIAGINDKEGYKKANEARLILKKRRTKVENDAEALRANAVKFQKTVISREKQLVAIIAGVEGQLKSKVDAIDIEKERIRIEEERREDALIKSRIDQLAKFGHGIDLYDAKIMPEENFQALLGEVEAAYIKEQQRIADEKAAAEARRLEEEQRLQTEREELARQKAEFEKREAALKELRERELEEQRQRDALIKAQQENKEAELRAEREKLEAEKRAIQAQKDSTRKQRLTDIGLIESNNLFEHPIFKYISIGWLVLSSIPDDQFDDAITMLRSKIDEAQIAFEKQQAEEKAERERIAKLEAERQEALRPDKEKLLDYLNKVFQSVPYPVVSTDHEVNLIMKEIITEMGELHDRLESRINNLK
jgi:colicin import membrane protein